MKITNIEEFRQLILEGKTIKQLQEHYGCSRTEVTDTKRLYGLVGISPNSKKLDRSLGEKVCQDCGITKPLSEFYSNGKTPLGKVKYKPSCISCENSSRYFKFWDMVQEYLSINGKTYACETCNDTDKFGFLDWHHIDPATKSFDIGSVSKSTSLDKFFDNVVPELNKCKLLCPSCHRREHLLLGLK
jgi:hypothetical protein